MRLLATSVPIMGSQNSLSSRNATKVCASTAPNQLWAITMPASVV